MPTTTLISMLKKQKAERNNNDNGTDETKNSSITSSPTSLEKTTSQNVSPPENLQTEDALTQKKKQHIRTRKHYAMSKE